MTQSIMSFESRPHDAQLNVELQLLHDRKEKGEIDSEQFRQLHKEAVMNSLERMIKKYAR